MTEVILTKKCIAFALILAIIFGLSACADETNLNPPPSYTMSTADESPVSEPVSEEQNSDPEQPSPDRTPIYDNTAIVSAYSSGDTSALSDFQLEIYNAAVSAIGEFYRNDMTEAETVTAAHDYITTHCTYDVGELELIPHRTENAENPYGALVMHNAICMGYTTSFQLFMDMLGIKSIIITGEALDEEHAWNMVRIEDKWYHVDCTWDDYVPDYDDRPAMHMYLFVTDGMMKIQHIWDASSAPEAVSEDLNYFTNNGTMCSSKDEIISLLSAAAEQGIKDVEVATTKAVKEKDIPFPKFDSSYVYSYWLNEFDTYNVIIYHIQYY